MKRLRLKCSTEEQPIAVDHKVVSKDCYEQFNEALDNYLDNASNRESVPYNVWYHTSKQWPPPINEWIVTANKKFTNLAPNLDVANAYVALQNLIYRTKVIKTKDQTDYWWMRVKLPC